MDSFDHPVGSLDELRELIPPPAKPSASKDLPALDDHCRALISRAPFLVMATADSEGRCDASPKGGPPGFVHVLDDHRLAIPDLPGNRRLDSIQNLFENPGVALLFVIPGLEETLRVNGRATLTRDPDLLARLELMGKPPKLAIGVEVEQAYIHCAKAFKRSGLWEPGEWPDLSELPSIASMLRDHYALGMSVEQVEERLRESYEKTLY